MIYKIKMGKMKKAIYLLAVAQVLWFGCDNKNEGYEISATFLGVEDSTKIYFQKVQDGSITTTDTADLDNSKVKFEGLLESPEMLYLKIGDSRKIVNVFAENSKISIKVHVDSLDQAEVKGSTVHDELIEFKKYMEPIDKKSEEINRAFAEARENGNEEKMIELRAESENLWQEQNDRIKSFIDNRNSSFLTPYIIKRYLSYELDFRELDELLSKLDTTVHKSADYQTLKSRVDVLSKVAVGEPAVDFALNDAGGNPISLSSFEGQVLLVDFWASWCGPCRRENPNVVKLYNDFHDKGFEILGVSFDKSRDNWLKAIEDDNLRWSHVSDLKGWDSAAGKLYAINSIPATVLIGRDGKIIAKNLRGEALRQKLVEIYAVEEQNI